MKAIILSLLIFPMILMAQVDKQTLSRYESQLSEVKQGILLLMDERAETLEGTLRYQDLEKNIGELDAKSIQTQDNLTLLQSGLNDAEQTRLVRVIENDLQNMKSTVQDVTGR